MRRVACIVALVACTSGAFAQERAPRWDLGASVGYALPVGSAERGAHVSDATYGLVPIRLDAAYRLTARVGIALGAAYAPAIPTLCQSAGECVSSVGSDFSLSARARFYLPRLGTVAPSIDVGLGYEWLSTKLVDNGVKSARGYHGPLLGIVEVMAPFRLGAGWTLGPALSGAAGVFTHASLDAPGISTSDAIADHAVHGWATLALRLGLTLR